MRKVVCNSTPLIALHKIGKLDLLESMYREIIIPKAVYDEVTIKENQENTFIGNYTFIKVKEINNKEAKRFFNTSLHKGEVEVMILAKEIVADLCVIDDLLARKYAEHYKLKITGTIGILIKAKKLNLIPLIKPLLDNLIKNGIYIDKKLYSMALKISEEE